MENLSKHLIVLFPGKSYTVRSPLLYYADYKYKCKGYESVRISYGDNNDINDVKNFVMTQMEKVDFSIYNDIVFLSKSMGTVIAGWLAETLDINVRHIYLTPTKNALQYIKRQKNISIVIAGTEDPLLDTDILKMHCKHEDIKLELIDGADHSLEISDDIDLNISILKQVVELY